MKFEDMINTIQLGDSYQLIKYIPDKSIDLVLTDPPYGINADKGVGGMVLVLIKQENIKEIGIV